MVPMRCATALAVNAELERMRRLTFCGCGDQFTAHDSGTCGACLAGQDQTSEIERLRTELLAAQEAAERWKGIAEVARDLANSSSRIGGIAVRLGLGA